jgi:glycosyltransferase involved in cell wall biosynthesis
MEIKNAPRQVLFCRSNPIAPDPRLEKAAQALARAGYGVQILGWDRTGTLPPEDRIEGVDCHRLPIKAAFGHGLGNLLPLLRWQWGCLRWMLRHRTEFDLIHACDFDTVLPALICQNFFGKQVIYDIFDFYADHLRATPAWIKGLIKALDRRVIRKVDGVILTDKVRLEQVGDLGSTPWTVICNTPQDLKGNFENQEPTQTSGSYSLRLVYVGLLQIERGLLDILEILKNHPNWHLDLAGFGGDEELLLAKARQLPNLHWHGRVPYQMALTLTAAADIVLALYDPALSNHRFASPNKLFEAMMLGKPVIVAHNTHIDEIVKHEECGLAVRYGDQEDIEKEMAALAVNADLRQNLGRNARQAYEQQYNWEKMEARLLQLYTNIDENFPNP